YCPVEMHFLEFLAIRFRLDGDRWEKSRNARGSKQDVAEQLQRLVIALCRDRAHVPDDPAAGVEIGRGDQITAALGMFGCDRLEQRGGYSFFDHALERPGIQEAFRRLPVLEYVRCRDVRKVLAEFVIELWTKKRIRTDQRADACACHQRKIR